MLYDSCISWKWHLFYSYERNNRKGFGTGARIGLKKEYDMLDTAYMQGISNAIHVFQSYGIEITMLYGGIDCDEKLNDAIFEILEKRLRQLGD